MDYSIDCLGVAQWVWPPVQRRVLKIFFFFFKHMCQLFFHLISLTRPPSPSSNKAKAVWCGILTWGIICSIAGFLDLHYFLFGLLLLVFKDERCTKWSIGGGQERCRYKGLDCKFNDIEDKRKSCWPSPYCAYNQLVPTGPPALETGELCAFT